jgi:hypoxanthine phosphoribosyltransferase
MMVDWAAFLQRTTQQDNYEVDSEEGEKVTGLDTDAFYSWLEGKKVKQVKFPSAKFVSKEKLDEIFDKAKKVFISFTSDEKDNVKRMLVKDTSETLQILSELADPDKKVIIYFEPKEEDYVISKSIGPGFFRTILHPKYNIDPDKDYYLSLDDFINKRNPMKAKNPSGQILLRAILADKLKVLIVDDNIQSGKDMLDVFKELKRLWTEIHKEEIQAREAIDNVETLQKILTPKAITSKTMQFHYEKQNRIQMYKNLVNAKDIVQQILNIDMNTVSEQEFWTRELDRKFRKVLFERIPGITKSAEVYKEGWSTLEKYTMGYVLYRVDSSVKGLKGRKKDVDSFETETTPDSPTGT